MKRKDRKSQINSAALKGLNRTIVLLFILALLGVSCQGSSSKTPAGASKKAATFAPPEVPPMFTSPESKLQFLVKNYWSTYNFADTTLVKNSDVTESAFANYIHLLWQADTKTAEKGLTAMLDGAIKGPKRSFDHFNKLCEKYLYDPNSPVRNEELYIPVLKYLIASPQIDSINKVRPNHLLKVALKNRPGSLAADFSFIQANGKRGHLYGVKADYTVLFFNNPGCHTCHAIKEEMGQSVVINRLLQASSKPRIQILAVYPDEDLKEWKKETYPANWINGYNPHTTIQDKQLYDLKAIPTLYLLDSKKQVVFKDVISWHEIENFLQSKL